jgi:RNA polymerase sigma-70 factor (ECF subfamily)
MHKEKEIFSDNYNSSPLTILEFDELETLVHDTIENLPDQCKQVFIMNRFKGMKYREIAELLNISLSTVKYHMSTALEKLREKLNGYLDKS